MKFNLNNEILEEVVSLVNDQYSFLDQLEELQVKAAPTTLKRLNSWQDFFNKNYATAPCMYSDMSFALIEASKSNFIFKSQTTHEFELSLKFFGRLFESRVFLKLNDLQSATMLLNISLIFSKFPGMVVGSINKAIKALDKGVDQISLQNMFVLLFVRYESPILLIRHLNFLSTDEIDLLMHVLKGNNIRSFEALPFKVSKKEAYIFIKALPEDLTFSDCVLARALVSSKLLIGDKGKPYLLNRFLASCKIFESDLPAFAEHINYWRSAFNIVSKVDWEASYISIQEFVDFFEYKKYNENPDYSLKGRTVNSIINAINAWHERVDIANNKKLVNLKWKRTSDKDISIKKFETDYLFKELTTGMELFRESESLKHCVFSYAEYCATGMRSIWSIQKRSRLGFMHYLTVEVSNASIIQVSGKYNREIDHMEFELIEEWAEIMQFENTCVVF